MYWLGKLYASLTYLPSSNDAQSMAIFFAGFTSLCETYALKASEESCGTEKLTTTLNKYLGKIVEGRFNEIYARRLYER